MSWSDARHAAWLPLDAVKCDQASNGCSRGLPSLRRVCGDDLAHRALADACGRPAQRARAAGHALDIVQHHFVARRVHRRRRAGLACCVSRDRAKFQCIIQHSMSARSHVCEPGASTSFCFVLCFDVKTSTVNVWALRAQTPTPVGRRRPDRGRGCPGQAGGRRGACISHDLYKHIPPLGTCS